MDSLETYIHDKAIAKHKTEHEWLEGCVKFIPKCILATHVGKFTNPDVEQVMIFCKLDSSENNGYVYTAGVNVDTDITVSSAAYAAAAGLLLFQMENGAPLYVHILQDDPMVKEVFIKYGIDFEATKNDIKKMCNTQEMDHSDERLRQVYFPISDSRYHLLTIMPASSLLITMKKRIQSVNASYKKSHDKDSTQYGTSCFCIFDYTEIGYGGANSQNVSIRNAGIGGVGYLLSSKPPVLDDSYVQYPRRDFFMELMPFWKFNDWFLRLHKTISAMKSNKYVRNARDNIVDDIIDEVILKSHSLRNREVGWSDAERCHDLPLVQRIWLDKKYDDDYHRMDWLDIISRRFGMWIIQQYSRYEKKQYPDDMHVLGDNELRYFTSMIKPVLKEEVMYSGE